MPISVIVFSKNVHTVMNNYPLYETLVYAILLYVMVIVYSAYTVVLYYLYYLRRMNE